MQRFIILFSILMISTIFFTSSLRVMKQGFPVEKALAQLQLQPFYPTATPTPTSGIPTNTPAPGEATNTPTPPATANPIECLVRNVSEQELATDLNTLTAGRTRYSGTGANTAAANAIKDYFETNGLTASLKSFSGRGMNGRQVNSNNIVGTRNGSQLPNEYYLLTAHMDSISPQASTLAPGADDNGTGTAVLMEAARVMKACNFQAKRSIELVGFSGEEEGLVGSKAYVNSLPAIQTKNVKGVINMDMVGYKRTGSDCTMFGYKTGQGGKAISDAAVAVNTQYSIGLDARSLPTSISGSDHYFFWNYQSYTIPTIFACECDPLLRAYPYYHKTTDTPDKVTISQLAKATKVIVATMAKLANQ